MRRTSGLKPSTGTRWPPAVVAHIKEHQGDGCIGPEAGMPGECAGPIDTDHVRASGGISLKSKSIAVNGARLCRFTHHNLKTREGKTWRPRLLTVIAQRHGECADCQRESITEYGVPLGEGVPS